MLGGGTGPPQTQPRHKTTVLKPVAACCKIHWNRSTAGQRTDMKIVPQLINYARINAQHQRFRCMVMVTVSHVIVLQSSQHITLGNCVSGKRTQENERIAIDILAPSLMPQ